MKHEVFWKNPGYKPRPELKNDIECDYLIVGGGITGVSLAYFLSSSGARNIVLVEKKYIGSGATGKSAGILTLRGELDLIQLLKFCGKERGIQFWKANKECLELIKSIIKKEKIECDFKPENTIFGSLLNGDAFNHSYLLKEYKIEKLVEKTSHLLSGDDIRKYVNTPIFKHAVFSYNHGVSVNPLKHVQELSRAAEKYGAKIYEKTKFLKIKRNIIKTRYGKIKFKKIIIAVDASYRKKEVKNIKSTIIVTEKLSREQLRKIGLLKKKFVWDLEDSYHYLKITKDNRILLGFGDKFVNKNHKKIYPHYSHLEEIKLFLKNLFPQINVKIEYAWSGTFGTTLDRIPLIEYKGNKITIAGCGSQVVCVMSAKYIADKLLGKKSELDYFFKI